jgi:hypothetical protein
VAWNITAQLIETCSCNMLWPCWFGVPELMVMDQGWCASALLFVVSQGASEGIDLAGCKLALAFDFPGPTLFDGNGVARLYIDDGASANQRRELEAIFQGKKGGPMEILGGLMSQWLPSQTTKIQIQEDGNTLTATVGESGRIQSRRLADEGGRPTILQNAGLACLMKTEDDAVQMAPSGSQWSDQDLPRRFETRSGVRGICRWSVN